MSDHPARRGCSHAPRRSVLARRPPLPACMSAPLAHASPQGCSQARCCTWAPAALPWHASRRLRRPAVRQLGTRGRQLAARGRPARGRRARRRCSSRSGAAAGARSAAVAPPAADTRRAQPARLQSRYYVHQLAARRSSPSHPTSSPHTLTFCAHALFNTRANFQAQSRHTPLRLGRQTGPGEQAQHDAWYWRPPLLGMPWASASAPGGVGSTCTISMSSSGGGGAAWPSQTSSAAPVMRSTRR